MLNRPFWKFAKSYLDCSSSCNSVVMMLVIFCSAVLSASISVVSRCSTVCSSCLRISLEVTGLCLNIYCWLIGNLSLRIMLLSLPKGLFSILLILIDLGAGLRSSDHYTPRFGECPSKHLMASLSEEMALPWNGISAEFETWNCRTVSSSTYSFILLACPSIQDLLFPFPFLNSSSIDSVYI